MKTLIVIPAYNEEAIIKETLEKLLTFCRSNLELNSFQIIVSDNNSIDATGQIVQALQKSNSSIGYLFLSEKGKGLAIKTAWQKYQDQFENFVFMDADLATDLAALPALINNLSQGFDLVVGSRYLATSKVQRSGLRKIFSFCYRQFLAIFLQTKIKDFPCGFKAINRRVLVEIVPQVKNQSWFFDSELLYLAEKAGFKIKEIPIVWAEPDGRQSQVSLFKVSGQYLKEIWRLKTQK